VGKRRTRFPDPTVDPRHAERVASRLAESIERLAAIHARSEERVEGHQRFVEHLTHQLGRPVSLYAVVAISAAWTGLNAAAPWFHLAPIDPPPFHLLQAVATLAALLATVMVLTTQNRESRHARHRALLDLEINLLAERKATKIIDLLEELRRDLPNVQNRADPIAEALTASVEPLGRLSMAIEAEAAAAPRSSDERRTIARDPPTASR